MRGAWIIAAALAVGALIPGTARAGVYFTSGTLVPEFARPDDPAGREVWPWYKPSKLFLDDWAGYRAAAAVENPPAGSLGAHYRQRVKELEARKAEGTLSLNDRIDLSAYHIRLGQYAKAVQLLESQGRRGAHFLLLANLATAYELKSAALDTELTVRLRDMASALLYRKMALAAWPTAYPGWDRFQLLFYYKVESYHLKLLQLRHEEATRRPSEFAQLRLDALFPGVQFVGASGSYEAGGIAPSQWAEIPADAINIVMVLVLWLPFDDRLQWQLGELLNASGEVSSAAAVMKPVVERGADPNKPDAARWGGGTPPELRRHYQVVAAAAEARKKETEASVALQDPLLDLKLLWALAPRGQGVGVSALIQEAVWPAVASMRENGGARPPEENRPGGTAGTGGSTPTEPAGWVPNWRQLAVGFGAGAVVALLLGLQVRQMGRPKT